MNFLVIMLLTVCIFHNSRNLFILKDRINDNIKFEYQLNIEKKVPRETEI